jgi:hypothetical protein
VIDPVPVAGNVTQSAFDLAGTGAQLFAMLAGAFLASASGLFVAWLLDRMARKRQERSIALVCLDLVASLCVIANLAKESRSRGDPYGPLTMRFVRGCMRDLDVYERNRERIADITDPETRADIYQTMARFTLALEGILGESEIIAGLDAELAAPAADAAKREAAVAQRQERARNRDASFDFLLDTVTECGALSANLRRLAKAEGLSMSDLIARNTQGAPPPPAN